MSRRDKQLQEIREQKLVKATSQIYVSTIVEILYESGLKKEDIEYILSELMKKADELSRGYIDVDTYVMAVEEKTGIHLK